MNLTNINILSAFENCSIGKRVGILSGILMIFTFGVSGLLLYTISVFHNSYSEIHDTNTVSIIKLGNVIDNLHRARIRTYDAMLSRNIARSKTLYVEFNDHILQVDDNWKAYQLINMDNTEQTISTKVNDQLPKVINFYQSIFQHIVSGDFDNPSVFLSQESTEQFRSVMSFIRELYKHQTNEIETRYKTNHKFHVSVEIICITLAVTALILGVLVSYFVVLSITTPVNKMIESMGIVASGKTIIKYDLSHRKDEVGKLASMLYKFKQYTEELLRLREDQVFTTKRQKDLLEHLVGEKTKALAVERDRALTAVRAKQDFLSFMTHELRTPMNVIYGFNELMLTTNLDEKQKKYSKNISDASSNLLEVIGEILDFASLESGNTIITRNKFDIREIIEEAIILYSPMALQKSVLLSSKIDHNLPNYLFGDEVRVKQVIINLTGNAIKFTERGTITIVTEYILSNDGESGSGQLKISVIDTGIGIPEDMKDKVFEQFKQVDSSYARKFSETGLGLAICDKLCKAMNGQIGVESTLGVGSTFWFIIPCSSSDKI